MTDSIVGLKDNDAQNLYLAQLHVFVYKQSIIYIEAHLQ